MGPARCDLPLAERLVERGDLTRAMKAGEAVYFPSDAFKAAAALHAAMFSARQSLN